jgi:hypothetical protein
VGVVCQFRHAPAFSPNGIPSSKPSPLALNPQRLEEDREARLAVLLAQPSLDLDVEYSGATAEQWARKFNFGNIADMIAGEVCDTLCVRMLCLQSHSSRLCAVRLLCAHSCATSLDAGQGKVRARWSTARSAWISATVRAVKRK